MKVRRVRPGPSKGNAASKKVTISLPGDLFDTLERERRREGIDRSSWVQKVVSEALAQRRHDEDVAAYIRSYTDSPESPEEIAEAVALSALAFDRLDDQEQQ